MMSCRFFQFRKVVMPRKARSSYTIKTASSRRSSPKKSTKSIQSTSKTKPLGTRVSNSGYKQFKDPQTGKWVYTHRRVAEKKVGGKIYSGREVHHIDGNKNNNRKANLEVLSKEEHRSRHAK